MIPSLSKEDLKQIETIKKDLPSLDDEIIGVWWLERAKKGKWPDCIPAWIHGNRDLKFLQSLRWEKTEIQP